MKRLVILWGLLALLLASAAWADTIVLPQLEMEKAFVR